MNGEKVVIDTNGILRFLLQDIPSQTDHVEALFDKAKQEKVVVIITPIVIFETVFALLTLYNAEKSAVSDMIASLLKTSYLSIAERDIFMYALPLFEKTSLSLPDAYILAYAKSIEGNVFTFDKKLKNAAKREGMDRK